MSQNELPEVINVDFDKTLTDPDECEWSEAHKREPNGKWLTPFDRRTSVVVK